ncbi:hypothetical protein [Sphingomonas glacialis]|uniref:Uncharacterized protein n=1 Tax=Sphingomonas glacialis TaxID=658225 RepID=A0A502FJQ8_9SPHN|nr:hypothetical protein [Sphingomonas glacialis]TPG49343.1 hypothetical protein EAH76_18505 [Sphingomonas glacialis]
MNEASISITGKRIGAQPAAIFPRIQGIAASVASPAARVPKGRAPEARRSSSWQPLAMLRSIEQTF